MASLPNDEQLEQEAAVEIPGPARLPYSFAKRHGVLIDSENYDSPKLVHRPDVSNMALLEARRLSLIHI